MIICDICKNSEHVPIMPYVIHMYNDNIKTEIMRKSRDVCKKCAKIIESLDPELMLQNAILNKEKSIQVKEVKMPERAKEKLNQAIDKAMAEYE